MSQKSLEIGSLVAVSNMLNPGAHLALVIDPSAGKKWADNASAFEYEPKKGSENGFVLVRNLGLRLSEGVVFKKGAPKEEPRETMVVRFAYAQITHAQHVAGPDVESIEKFLESVQLCHHLGMHGADFFNDVSLLAEYLRGVTRTPDQIGFSNQKFLAMLTEILPQAKVA